MRSSVVPPRRRAIGEVARVAAVALMLMVMVRPALAAPHVELRWSSPAGCPSQAEVEGLLAEVLATSEVTDRLVVDATVRPMVETEGRWALDLRFSGASSGTRNLTASGCEPLTRSGILVIAMVYDPLVTPPPPAEPPAPPPVEPPPPAPIAQPPTLVDPPPAPWRPPLAPPPVPQPPPPDEPPSRPRIGVAAMGLGDLGSLPRAAAGFRGDVRVRGERWLAALHLGYLPGVDGILADRPSTGGTVSAFTFGGGGCGIPWTTRAPEPALGQLALRACLSAEAGRMTASGFGVERPAQGSAWLGVVEGSAGFDVWLAAPLALVAELGLGVPLTRPNFFLNNIGDVHRPGPVRGRLGLGLEATF
ncbi:MAG: hypothetical protein R3B72_28150 [Polyangiaceae bacterium]